MFPAMFLKAIQLAADLMPAIHYLIKLYRSRK